jgi:hypothetical protein
MKKLLVYKVSDRETMKSLILSHSNYSKEAARVIERIKHKQFPIRCTVGGRKYLFKELEPENRTEGWTYEYRCG